MPLASARSGCGRRAYEETHGRSEVFSSPWGGGMQSRPYRGLMKRASVPTRSGEPASEAASVARRAAAQIATRDMTHDPGAALDAMDVMLERDPGRRRASARTSATSAACSVAPKGCRSKYGKTRACSTRRSRRAASSARRWAWAAYGLRPVARDPVRRLLLSRPPTRSSPRRRACATARPADFIGADHCAHRPLRRRHLRRADAQPEPGSDVYPCVRPEDRGAEHAV